MNKEQKENVLKRCGDALQENNEYMEMEYNEIDPDVLQAKAEYLCYLKGYHDRDAEIKNVAT